jgi:hypothetical protein
VARIMGAEIRAQAAREDSQKAIREADRATTEAWSVRMEGSPRGGDVVGGILEPPGSAIGSLNSPPSLKIRSDISRPGTIQPKERGSRKGGP